MLSFEKIKKVVTGLKKHQLIPEIALFLIREYEMNHPNLRGIVLREAAKPDFILLTTEGEIGDAQVIRIPENLFEYDLILVLNLLAHEMIHVKQKDKSIAIEERNEREWQAYYEMLFHKEFPLIPMASHFHQKFFAAKGLDYYKRMGEGSNLQRKYEEQKKEVEALVALLS